MLDRRKFLSWTLLSPACFAVGCTTPTVPDPNLTQTNIAGGNATGGTGARKPRQKRVTPQPPPPTDSIPALGSKLEIDEVEWKKRLSELQYKVLREADTEDPWTGAYLKNKTAGIYHCAACNNPLFASGTKFNSKTGWPSFWQPVHEQRVSTRPDPRYEMERTEVLCGHCDGHLGHVFNDGPQPTGLRYCVNSVSLYLRPSEDATDRP
jgi:peptide-methionine (R)-S-oxide reductase